MLKNILLVGLGGFAGSVLRYAISLIASSTVSFTHIPVGTLLVNVVGSLVIGFLLTAVKAESWYHFAVIGLCGGFTTFSTFSADTVRLLRDGLWNHALAYIALSVVVCLVATFLGAYVGSRSVL